MLDIGMSELLVVGIVALIVVGPKDLPGMFRTLGKFTARVRALGREFSRAMEQAADESGVKDVADGLKAATNPAKFGLDKVKDAAKDVMDWHPEDDIENILPPKKAKMTPERAEMAQKISDNAAKMATKRHQAEAEAAKAAEAGADAAAPKPAAKKAAPKKAPAKKTATKKAPEKTATAKKPAAKKPAAKKTVKKPTATKTAKKTGEDKA